MWALGAAIEPNVLGAMHLDAGAPEATRVGGGRKYARLVRAYNLGLAENPVTAPGSLPRRRGRSVGGQPGAASQLGCVRSQLTYSASPPATPYFGL